jgi:flavin-dependent dehydrogenase
LYPMSDTAELFDVLIIGASLAGSSLAIRLGRAGFKTALIDRSHFPRRKICGEGLSAVGVAQLCELAGSAAVLNLPHAEFSGYTICTEHRNTEHGNFEIPLSRSDRTDAAPCSGLGIQRFHVDKMLVRIAAELDAVQFFPGENVRHLRQQDSTAVLNLAQQQIRGRWLILADGANSILASRLGFNGRNRTPGRYAWSFAAEGDYRRRFQHVHVILQEGKEILCTPISDHELNITVLAAKDGNRQFSFAEKQKRSITEILDLLERHTGFICRRRQPSAACTVVSRRRRAAGNNCLLIGDCCETLDPIGGMGMTHALLSSALAAEALIAVRSGKETAERALQNYESKRLAAVRPLRGFTWMSHLMLRYGTKTCLLPIFARSSLLTSVSNAVHHSSRPQDRRGSAAEALIYYAGRISE